MTPIDSILAEARKIGEEDKEQSLRFLHSFRDTSHYFPWLSLEVAKLNRGLGRNEESQKEVTLCLSAIPGFLPIIAFAIELNRFKYLYRFYCDLFIDAHSESNNYANDFWAQKTLLEAFFGSRHSSDNNFQPNLLLTHEPMVSALVYRLAISSFLASVENYFSIHNANSGFATWTLIYSKDGGHNHNEKQLFINCYCIFLAFPQMHENIEWNFLLDMTINGLGSIIYDLTYNDDCGAFFSHIVAERTDSWRLQLWKLMRSRVLNNGALKKGSTPLKKLQISPGSLVVRTGNVELWALWSLLHFREATLNKAEQLCNTDQDKISSHIKQIESEEWWPRVDHLNNLLRFSSNSGWYASSNNAKDSLILWSNKYTSAIIEGQVHSLYWDHMASLCAVLPELQNKDFHRFDEYDVASWLNGQRIVFASPFADIVQKHYDEGRIDEFWRETKLNVQVDCLRTVRADVSVWPYRPHSGWRETYSLLFLETCEAIRDTKATLFIGSCGCYGLPLAYDINKTFGITSVYFGHISHIIFGVFTEAFRNHPLRKTYGSSRHWINGNLEDRFPQVARIDGGRYVRNASGD